MPGQIPSSICVACLDKGLGEQLKTAIQLWSLNQGIKMENVQHHLQNSLWLLSAFTKNRNVPKLLTDKMNAKLLHLFMQQNCLEYHHYSSPILHNPLTSLWRVTIQWTLVDSENVRAEPILAFI